MNIKKYGVLNESYKYIQYLLYVYYMLSNIKADKLFKITFFYFKISDLILLYCIIK